MEPSPVLEKEVTKRDHLLLQADTKAWEAPAHGAVLASLVAKFLLDRGECGFELKKPFEFLLVYFMNRTFLAKGIIC